MHVQCHHRIAACIRRFPLFFRNRGFNRYSLVYTLLRHRRISNPEIFTERKAFYR